MANPVIYTVGDPRMLSIQIPRLSVALLIPTPFGIGPMHILRLFRNRMSFSTSTHDVS